MALTKVGGDVIQNPLNVGIITATRIDGNVSGDVNSTGVSTFTTLKVGTGVTISGGIVTATTFSGALTGNVTGNATGLSGTPNITVGSIIASSATISGNVSVAGTLTYEDVTNVDSIGIVTARTGVRIDAGGLVVVGVTTVAAGSTAAPSITPTGDTDTGIFFPSADTIAFSEGGAEALRIDSSGNVGIGTNISNGLLSLSKSSGRLLTLRNSTTGFGANAGSYFSLNGSDLQISNAESANLIVYTNDTERVRITSSGNVGIGTNNPLVATHIAIPTNGTALKLNNTIGGSGSYVDLDFDTYATSQVGYANAPATIRVIDDGGYSGHISFRTKGSSIGASQTERLRITSSGNVGIGTTNPGEKLQVDGNLRLGGSNTSNYIAFRGTTGDNPGAYDHTYVGERLYGGDERSELLLFKGNDFDSGSGPDRIRLAAAEIRFDTYSSTAVSGSFESVATSANVTNKMTLTNAGNLGIGTTNPGAKLSVGSGSLVDGNVPVQISTPSANGIAYYGANNNGSYGALFGYDRGAYSGGVVRVVGATDTIDFVVNNTTKAATILPSGNFGIGTENPVAKLEVQSSAAPKIISNYNNSKHIGMSVGGSGGGFTLSDGHFLTINHQPYADRGTDANLTERVRITSSGNVQLPGRTFVRNGSNTVIAASGSYLECIGFKDSNASAFDMFDIVGIQGQTTVSLEIRHGHEGGGTHGSWLRWVGALNAYTDITVNYNVANNYGGGLGFTITRPQHDIIRVTWNGANGFPSSFSLACRIWLGRNPNVTTLTNLGMNGFSSSINYS